MIFLPPACGLLLGLSGSLVATIAHAYTFIRDGSVSLSYSSSSSRKPSGASLGSACSALSPRRLDPHPPFFITRHPFEPLSLSRSSSLLHLPCLRQEKFFVRFFFTTLSSVACFPNDAVRKTTATVTKKYALSREENDRKRRGYSWTGDLRTGG